MRKQRGILTFFALLLIAVNVQGRCHDTGSDESNVIIEEGGEHPGPGSTTESEESSEEYYDDGYEVIAEWHNTNHPGHGHSHEIVEQHGDDYVIVAPPPAGGGEEDYNVPPGGGGEEDYNVPPGGGGEEDYNVPPGGGGEYDYGVPPVEGDGDYYVVPPVHGGGNDYDGHGDVEIDMLDYDRESRCEMLANALLQALSYAEMMMAEHGATEEDGEAMRESMISYVGLDLTDRPQVREFACRLVDVETVTQLAEVLHMPENMMRAIYLEYRTQLAIIGGYEGMHIRMMLGLQLATALRAYGGEDRINPAEIRSQMTHDDLVGLLDALQREFGVGFLVLLSWMPFDDSLIIRDMDAFATALLGFTTVENLSRETGIDVEYIHALHDNVHEIARLNLKPEGVDIYLNLVYAIENTGLLDLQI